LFLQRELFGDSGGFAIGIDRHEFVDVRAARQVREVHADRLRTRRHLLVRYAIPHRLTRHVEHANRHFGRYRKRERHFGYARRRVRVVRQRVGRGVHCRTDLDRVRVGLDPTLIDRCDTVRVRLRGIETAVGIAVARRVLDCRYMTDRRPHTRLLRFDIILRDVLLTGDLPGQVRLCTMTLAVRRDKLDRQDRTRMAREECERGRERTGRTARQVVLRCRARCRLDRIRPVEPVEYRVHQVIVVRRARTTVRWRQRMRRIAIGEARDLRSDQRRRERRLDHVRRQRGDVVRILPVGRLLADHRAAVGAQHRGVRDELRVHVAL